MAGSVATSNAQPYVDESRAFEEDILRRKAEAQAVVKVLNEEMETYLLNIEVALSEYIARAKRKQSLENVIQRISKMLDIAIITTATPLKDALSISDVRTATESDTAAAGLVSRLQQMREGLNGGGHAAE